MSRRGPSIDFNPLLVKVQNDINFLCYLGLHQYAKEHKLIGRSRPMITTDLDFMMQKRLNFRLVVACIQQIVGGKTFFHGGREEQINYVNVGEYSMLRLYGLLNRDMFAIDTTDKNCLTGYWPHQFAYADIERLRTEAPISTFEQNLTYNTRAAMEVGGETFTNHLRAALRYIPNDLIEFAPHQQRDPKNRMNVKNLAIPLRLMEDRHFHIRENQRFRQTLQPGHNIRLQGSNIVHIPSHIEQLLHFRHVSWPWIQSLNAPEARDAFTYIAGNFPSLHAIQMKIRKIRESQAERNRRIEEQELSDRRRQEAREELRDRLLATYGEREMDPVMATPGVRIDNGEPIHRMGEVEPLEYLREIPAEFIETDIIIEGAETPEQEIVAIVEERRRQAIDQQIIPIPDVHVDTDFNTTTEDIQDRIRRALGMPQEEE